MTIEYSKQAVKSIMRIDVPTRQRIRRGIEKLPHGDIKRLKGYSSLFRLRIGDWRILFTMTSDSVKIDNILPRGSAYNK